MLHVTAVDVYGVGCLIGGKPGIGKSESALELVERGHRLVADALVELKRPREDYLYAQKNKVLSHHMEIRGLGILNLAKKYPSSRLEQACQAALESKSLSYKVVKDELEWLAKQTTPSIPEALPAHDNIRGHEYYQ